VRAELRNHGATRKNHGPPAPERKVPFSSAARSIYSTGGPTSEPLAAWPCICPAVLSTRRNRHKQWMESSVTTDILVYFKFDSLVFNKENILIISQRYQLYLASVTT
jgi:hypothetical protein